MIAMNKKLFMLIVLASLIVFLLITAPNRVQEVSANPISVGIPAPPPIEIESPINTTYSQSDIQLNFTIMANPNWWIGAYHITDVYYEYDGQAVHFNSSSDYSNTLQYSTLLANLTSGVHILTAYAAASGLYYPSSNSSDNDTYSIVSSQSVTFTVHKNFTNTFPSPSSIPSPTSTPITSFYGGGYYGSTSYENYCSFYITMSSPDAQTIYNDTMPLKFNITWITYPRSPFPVPPALNGYYAYKIDNEPFVRVASNQSVNDVFYQRPANNFTVNPSFSYLVDISHLEKGHHQIALNASIYFSTLDTLHFNMTTSPYTFLVGETTPNPSTKPTLSISPAPSLSTSLSPTSSPSSTSTPTTNPSEPPAQQPTTEPTQIPDRPKMADFAPVIIPTGIIFITIVAVVSLVYFRRKNKTG